MAIETTYTHLREKLAVRRRNSRDVALIPATELAALVETAHLLRSPKNAQRLLSALRRAQGQIYMVSENRVDFLQARYHC